MPDQKLPVLIFAQSARFISEIATQAGYTVWVADCYGDVETLQLAERYSALPALNQLSLQQFLDVLCQLSQGEACQLVCGTGIERFYPQLNTLPDHIQLIGNSAKTIEQLRQPQQFFALLDSLQLPYPNVCFKSPNNPEHYLLKSMDGAGGMHISMSSPSYLENTQFYQQRVEGQSASVCFIADGQRAEILSFNWQFTQQDSYILSHIVQQDKVDEIDKSWFEKVLSELVIATGLRGLNSLDFMIDHQGHVLLLEVNPRISASAELLAIPNLFEAHVQACDGKLRYLLPAVEQPKVSLLRYFFADTDCKVMDNEKWPNTCHDLPVVASIIKSTMPICTVIIHASSMAECLEQYQQVTDNIWENHLN